MKKTLSLIFLMWMILQVHADLSRATSGNLNNNFTVTGACSSGDCLIGDEVDAAADFPMNSHVARMLYDVSKSFTGRTPNRNQASVNCPQNQGYRTCLPSKNGGAPRQKCGDYTRNC